MVVFGNGDELVIWRCDVIQKIFTFWTHALIWREKQKILTETKSTGSFSASRWVLQTLCRRKHFVFPSSLLWNRLQTLPYKRISLLIDWQNMLAPCLLNEPFIVSNRIIEHSRERFASFLGERGNNGPLPVPAVKNDVITVSKANHQCHRYTYRGKKRANIAHFSITLAQLRSSGVRGTLVARSFGEP